MGLSGPWLVMLHFCLGPGGAKDVFALDLCFSLSVRLNCYLLWSPVHTGLQWQESYLLGMLEDMVILDNTDVEDMMVLGT